VPPHLAPAEQIGKRLNGVDSTSYLCVILAESEPPIVPVTRMNSVPAEGDLVVRLKARDAQAVDELYDRYGKLLYSIILRAVRNEATAEDLAQEAFVRIWARIQSFDSSRGSFEAWLVTVARNRAFDYLRTARRARQSVNIDELSELQISSPREDASDKLAQERTVKEALESLNPEQRKVIELTHFEGLTQTEIADKLSKPLGTVKSLVRSALKVLRTSAAGDLS
jgi:RNA polymerase sigma-70 factor, ECF subfamily